MWQFVKYSLATVVGLFLFAFVSLLLLAGVGAAMGSSDEVYDLKDNSVLKLDLNRPIVENATTEDNPFAALTDLYFAPPEKAKTPPTGHTIPGSVRRTERTGPIALGEFD